MRLTSRCNVQQGWTSEELYFQNAFSNSHFDSPLYFKLSKHKFSGNEIIKKILELSRSLQDLEDAANVWKRHLLQTF